MKESFIRAWTNFSYAAKNDKFWAYIIVGIVIGGLGIWLPGLVKGGTWSELAIPSNHLTYSFAILITLAIEALLIYEKKDDENNLGLGLIFGIIAILCSLIGYAKDLSILSVIGTIIAIIIYATATANSEKFRNKSKAISSSSSLGYSELDPNKLNKER